MITKGDTKNKVKTPIFGRSIHVPLKKLKKIDLEKIEEEMWRGDEN